MGGPATAQSLAPSQVTPRVIAPSNDVPQAVRPPELTTPDTRPLPNSELEFESGDVVIDGAFAEMQAENADFVAGTAHRHLSVAQLFAAAQRLEQAYAARGYILARVIVPRQRLGTGDNVHVQVIDGYIESIDTANLPDSIRRAVDRRTRSLVGMRHLTESRIERALLLAGNLNGLRLAGALARGQAEGGVRLILEGQLDRLAVRVGVDNRLPPALGRWNWTANLALNNLLHEGEQAYVVLGSSLADIGHTAGSSAPLTTIGGGLTAPVGTDGLTMSGEYLYSRVHVDAAGAPVSEGNFSRAQFRLQQSLIINRRQQLNLRGSLDRITQTLDLPDFDTTISRDRYYALRVGTSWQRWIGTTSVSVDLLLSNGLGGRRGSRALPNSRVGASPTFTRVEDIVRVGVPLGAGFGLDLTSRAQTGFGKPLYLSEQFPLDADNAVSAFPTGSLNVDTGATLRGELGFPPIVSAKGFQASGYLYAAGGAGRLSRATAVERSAIRAAGLGFGARTGLNALPLLRHTGATLAFEFGHQFSNITGRSGGNRASIATELRF